MPSTKERYFNPASFDHVRGVLDRALESERGIEVPEPPNGPVNFIQKLNYFRKKDRQQSHSIYEKDDPRCGRSAYDGLIFSQGENGTVVITKASEDMIEVKEL